MKLDYRGGVSIAELVVYGPALITAIYISYRHGLGRSSGWIFLVIFALVRIGGSSCQLATLSSDSTDLETATVILSSIGLSPLLLAALGLLSRIFDSINQRTHTFFNKLFFHIIQVPITVGLILCIVGGTNSASSSNPSKVNTLTKVGIILYVVGFVAICAITIAATRKFSCAGIGEQRLIVAVAVTLPWLSVRLAYSILASFTHMHRFNFFSGNVTILLVMAILEEFFIVITYLIVGMILEVAPRTSFVSAPYTSTRHVEHRAKSGTEELNVDPEKERRVPKAANDKPAQDSTLRRTLGRGPLGYLVFAALDKANHRSGDVEAGR